MSETVVGRVSSIRRYPLKSMPGEEVALRDPKLPLRLGTFFGPSVSVRLHG